MPTGRKIRVPDAFHIGAFRAGSVYISRHFIAHPDIYFTETSNKLQSRFPNDRYGAVRHYVKVMSKSAGRRYRGQKVVLDFYQNVFLGYVTKGYWQYRAWHRDFSDHLVFDPDELPRRISLVNPNAKILFCIRNQADWLRSVYDHFNIHGHRFKKWSGDISSFPLFLETVEGKCVLNAGQFDVTIDRYAGVFGIGNVHAYLLEDLRDDNAGTLGGIAEFLGVPWFKPLDDEDKAKNSGSPYSFEIGDAHMDMVRSFYAAGNQRLARFFDKQRLKEAGYI